MDMDQQLNLLSMIQPASFDSSGETVRSSKHQILLFDALINPNISISICKQTKCDAYIKVVHVLAVYLKK